MNNNHNPQDDWENLFDQMPLDTQPRDEHREQLKSKVLAAFDAQPATIGSTHDSSEGQGGLNKRGHRLMAFKALTWTAATLLLGIAAWMVQTPTTAFAFEDVLRNIVNCKTATYDFEVSVPNVNETITQQHYYMAPGRTRVVTDDVIMINDGTKVLSLIGSAKTATVIKLQGDSERQDSPGNLFEVMRDLVKTALSDPDFEYEELGEKTIDGQTLAGIAIETPTGQRPTRFAIWIDPTTRFPAQVEVDVDGSGTVVAKNYQFNVELDESLFSTDVPDGYTLSESVTVDLTTGMTEDAFIAGLKNFVETTGKFPAGISPPEMMKELINYAMESDLMDQKNPQQAMMDLMEPVCKFPSTLKKDSKMTYNAKAAKAGDSSRPVFWYKPKGEDQFRVVYADFSVKAVAEEPVVE